MRWIFRLPRPNVLKCSKCAEFALYRQVMQTVRGIRPIQYLCRKHAEELAAKWDIQIEE